MEKSQNHKRVTSAIERCLSLLVAHPQILSALRPVIWSVPIWAVAALLWATVRLIA